eukprot:CAMPEP_0118927178 /NCGR_PEP_ID=MMETSP1169-20130426/4704_1 /TAXON_ID=36882 /ORGANISM="Pyramimonas obovata, Strain CCMP722" /LENGTH=382 /DNA_ID=CAMNT_0006868885 /DNA_START=313 /DNA_END=1461 /DNA_ORIENTATION=-
MPLVALSVLLAHAAGAACPQVNPAGKLKGRNLPLPNVVGFWHIGPSYYSRDDNSTRTSSKPLNPVILKQLEELKSFRMFKTTEIRFLNETDGGPIDAPTLAVLRAERTLVPVPTPTLLKLYREAGPLYEFPTLYTLWKHCHANPVDYVFYVHTKTNDGERTDWQRKLFRNVDEVLAHLDQGIRVYGATYCRRSPWCHVTGNFWWARCDHVQRLSAPFDPVYLHEQSEFESIKADNPRVGLHNELFVPPKGRFMAEYWVMSDFLGNPGRAELMSGKFNWTRTDPKDFWPQVDKGACLHSQYGDLCDHARFPCKKEIRPTRKKSHTISFYNRKTYWPYYIVALLSVAPILTLSRRVCRRCQRNAKKSVSYEGGGGWVGPRNEKN